MASESVSDRQARERKEVLVRHARERKEVEDRHAREVQELKERHARESGPGKRRRVATPGTERLRNPKLYVLGGKSGAVMFSSAERLDPASGLWSDDGVES